MTIEDVVTQMETFADGLTQQEAKARFEKHGPNELLEKDGKSAWVIFFRQFADIMILVLVVAAVVSGSVGDLKDTIVIIVIVILNAIIGFVQEYRAEKTMQSLKKIAAPNAMVLRDKHSVSIPAMEIVPGDIVLLEAGNIVPADLRISKTASLKIDESSLTGESVPVDKTAKKILPEDTVVADRINMAYKGTIVVHGHGRAVVVATGMQTELGKIAGMLQEKSSVTPLQRRMSDFSKKLSIIILAICVLLFTAGCLRGENRVTMLLTAISLAVAAIPEALPAVITISLAIGAKRLAKRNALTRNLHAVETLGSVSYICTDKTGTLTQNKMTVQHLWPHSAALLDEPIEEMLLLLAMLNHDVKESYQQELSGDPTEIAIYRYATQQRPGLKAELGSYPRVAEIPFDAERKCMTTIHVYGDKFLVTTKGAFESVLKACNSNGDKHAIGKQSDAFSTQGMRVIAYAMKFLHELPEQINVHSIEKELEFIGLAGMIDPARAEAAEAIKECKTAGIITVMITGDHPLTATAIATTLGIISDSKDVVITGSALAAMSEEAFEKIAENVKVYARVSPEQKMQIVKALQKKHHFVAMTGDGVNDAPSLRIANIGIAMGITGTDVAKEAAHMTLLDDNFATIVKAVKEGRRIYDNIRKFVRYIMTCNSAEILAIALAPMIGLPVPLLPIQILWINLVTDGLPALALAFEPSEKDIMLRPPRKPDESIFSGGMVYHIIWIGLLMAALTLGTQAAEIYLGSGDWQTIVFTVLCLAQMWQVLAVRSETASLFTQGLLSNKLLTLAVLLTFVLQLMLIYIPSMNTIFNTKPLTITELLTAILVSSVIFITVETEKFFKRRKRRNALRIQAVD